MKEYSSKCVDDWMLIVFGQIVERFKDSLVDSYSNNQHILSCEIMRKTKFINKMKDLCQFETFSADQKSSFWKLCCFLEFHLTSWIEQLFSQDYIKIYYIALIVTDSFELKNQFQIRGFNDPFIQFENLISLYDKREDETLSLIRESLEMILSKYNSLAKELIYTLLCKIKKIWVENSVDIISKIRKSISNKMLKIKRNSDYMNDKILLMKIIDEKKKY